MNSDNFQERLSNIQILEKDLNILANESIVKTPYPTIKSLFYNTKPKNRKNLKKLELIKNENDINGKINNLKKINRVNIESIIHNSKTSEFLSSDNTSHFNKPKIIYCIQDYQNQNSSSTLYTVNGKNNGRISNNLKKNLDEISNNIKNNALNKSANSLPVMESKKVSKMSNDVSIQKTVNLNDLYNEFIENVSIFF